MGERPENPAVADWSGQSMFTGALTCRNNLSAVIRIDALVQPRNVEADQTPADSKLEIMTLGLFRIMARDDGQPDPVHVGQMLFAMLAKETRASTLVANWGNRCVGTITRPARHDGDLIATAFILPPALVRQTVKFISEACDAGSL